MALSKETSLVRLDGVDLLRGLAIFFVLMNHVNMRLLGAKVPYTKGLPDQLVSSLVWNGQLGVQMFFAVSGFLITSTTLRRWSVLASIGMREFYVLRFARIARCCCFAGGAERASFGSPQRLCCFAGNGWARPGACGGADLSRQPV